MLRLREWNLSWAKLPSGGAAMLARSLSSHRLRGLNLSGRENGEIDDNSELGRSGDSLQL